MSEVRRTCRDGLVKEEVSEDGVDRLAVGRIGNVLAEGGVGLRDDEVVPLNEEMEVGCQLGGGGGARGGDGKGTHE